MEQIYATQCLTSATRSYKATRPLTEHRCFIAAALERAQDNIIEAQNLQKQQADRNRRPAPFIYCARYGALERRRRSQPTKADPLASWNRSSLAPTKSSRRLMTTHASWSFRHTCTKTQPSMPKSCVDTRSLLRNLETLYHHDPT